MIVETEAVVLHAMKYGETSKIVTLYSKKFGKIKIIAKGVRSQKNKFGSSLEPMTISSVVFYKKEQRDLHLLSKSEIAEPITKLQNDSERMATGLALVELVNMVMHDEEENKAVYQLLRQSLETIDGAERNHLNILIAFMLKMFGLFGFGISLSNCAVCKKNVEELHIQFANLRLSDGKFICSGCSEGAGFGGVKIDWGVLKSLHYLQNCDVPKATVLALKHTTRNEMIATLESYLRYHIEGSRTLKSLSLLYSTK
jgi:DNA repair protein RecO (recombination protein O)